MWVLVQYIENFEEHLKENHDYGEDNSIVGLTSDFKERVLDHIELNHPLSQNP